MTISTHKIQFDTANAVRLLNELRFEKNGYIKEHGWYDRNMIKEITDEEIMTVLEKVLGKEDAITTEIAYTVIDTIKQNTDWYRYKNEDGLFHKN